VFTLTADVEESSTRSEDISMDYDFFHSDDMLSLSCGKRLPGIGHTRGHQHLDIAAVPRRCDGFSILYYQDVDSLVYWANEAAYRGSSGDVYVVPWSGGFAAVGVAAETGMTI
jgi:hypothetical protein